VAYQAQRPESSQKDGARLPQWSQISPFFDFVGSDALGAGGVGVSDAATALAAHDATKAARLAVDFVVPALRRSSITATTKVPSASWYPTRAAPWATSV